MAKRRKRKPEVGKDFVWENGRFVFTREYLLSLETCCENDCPRCPYDRLPVDPGSNGNGQLEPAQRMSPSAEQFTT